MHWRRSEPLRAIEKYIKENIWKDKRSADWVYAGTATFDAGDQTLHKFHIVPWDIARGAYILFEVAVLVDRNGQVLDKAVYDNRNQKIEPPVVTKRIVDTYLEGQASRDMRQRFVNPNVIIRSM